MKEPKQMTMEEKISFIQAYTTPAELWGQLAEEATELAQAALKMQRLYLNNKPAKTEEECRQNVIEEHADLQLLLMTLDWKDKDQRKPLVSFKASRWVKRISENDLKAYIDLRRENAETCVMCGDVVPEGRMVCPRCEAMFPEHAIIE